MKSFLRIALVAGVPIAITLAHYGWDIHDGAVHDILQRAYYLPIILAGLWYGWRGGLLTALGITVAYFPHAYHGWHGPHSFLFRMMEIGMYHVVGGLTGLLSGRLRAALDRERAARAEQEVAYERLQEKTRELFSAEEQLQRADRLAALGRMSASLAHEIRNPLNSIKSAAQVMQADLEKLGWQEHLAAKGTKPPDFLGIIGEEAERLDRTLENYLSFARAEQRGMGGEPTECRLAGAIERTVDLLRLQLDKRNIVMNWSREECDLKVGLCCTHLQQVFLNLFLNALDAVSDGGEVRVSIHERASENVTLAFEDTGPGISPTVAPHIFDPFYSTKPGGTGLGLAIVQRIMKSHGGNIRLATDSLPSSRFLLTFPIAS